MKLAVDRAALLKSMSHAQSVVERRNTIPILANVLIRAEDDQLSLTATDLDIEVVEKLPARIAASGAVTAPAQMLHEIVRKLPDGAEIALSHEDDRLTVSAGRSRFNLATLPAADFPAMASADYACRYEMRVGDLSTLFEKARFAISTEETRYYLNGVYLHVAINEAGAKNLMAVATDGHRLARIACALPNGAENAPGVIVPRKTVGEISKILDDDDAVAQIAVSDAKIRIECGPVVMTSKVIDGNFPDYSRVIPKNNNKRLDVDAKLFASAVDRVSTVSAEKSRAVKLSLEEDKLTLSVISPDSGSADEELTAAYGGPAMEVGFNAKYLLEITGQIARDNASFWLSDPGAPVLVREGEDDGAIYVVMPMRV